MAKVSNLQKIKIHDWCWLRHLLFRQKKRDQSPLNEQILARFDIQPVIRTESWHCRILTLRAESESDERSKSMYAKYLFSQIVEMARSVPRGMPASTYYRIVWPSSMSFSKRLQKVLDYSKLDVCQVPQFPNDAKPADAPFEAPQFDPCIFNL